MKKSETNKKEENSIDASRTLKKLNIDLKNKNLKLSQINIDLENKNLELSDQNIDLENKIIQLEQQVEELNILIQSQTNKNIGDQTNRILINDVHIFGKESLDHITQRILEKSIEEIIEIDTEEFKNKFLQINGQRYKREHIRDIDIHILLTKLIYCVDAQNKTIKKENGLYFINGDNGWETVSIEYLNNKILTKHQEVLTICENTILENKIFMRSIKHYFQDDENYDLIIKPTGIHNTFLEHYPRNNILKKILEYELDNIDKLINLKVDHINNITT